MDKDNHLEELLSKPTPKIIPNSVSQSGIPLNVVRAAANVSAFEAGLDLPLDVVTQESEQELTDGKGEDDE